MIKCPITYVHRWLALAVSVFLLAACSSGQDFDLAQAQIVRFRELTAALRFEQVYSEAADEFKKATTEQTMVRLLAAIGRKLGAVKNAARSGWTVNYNVSGTSVLLKFKTEFEKGTGYETFVYRIAAGKALLVGYHINSDEFFADQSDRTHATFVSPQ